PDTRTCEMSEPITSNPSTSSVEGSRAKTSASPARAPGSTESEAGSGRSTPESFASYDPATSSWRTSQHSLFGGLSEFSETWPRSGTMRSGIAYPRPPLAPRTSVTGSSLSPVGPNSDGFWPTPVADGDRATNYAQG